MATCKICNKEFKNLSIHISASHSISLKEYYDKYLKRKNEAFCKNCGTKTKWINLNKGYCDFCSKECRLEYRRNQKLEVRICPVCEQEFKVKKTSTQKYCSNKCMTNSKEVKEKRIKTSLKRYGVKNPAQSRKAKNSARKTSLERYGANSFPESKEFKKKYIDTMQKRYGVDNSFQLEQVKEKKKKTYLKRYGVDCPLKSKELKKKGRKTKLEKYGDETYNNHKQASITRLNHSYKVVLERISELVEPLFSLSEFDGVGTKKKRFKFKCLKCGNAFEDYLKDGHVPRCLNCYPLESFCGYSNAELELIDFIKSIVNTEIDHGNKKILNGKQLDLYLPEYKLAIEYDGLYWHSEIRGIEKNYHLNKTEECEKLGIKLIHIFEDEWIYKRNIVKSMLTNELNMTQNKVFARNCYLKEIESKTAREFLEINHLNGYVPSKINIGLFNDKLIAVAAFGAYRFSNKYNWELNRFATKLNYNVIGGLSKIYTYFLKNYEGPVISFVDRRYSSKNNFYSKILRCEENISSPNYWYFNKNHHRESRIKYQKHKLPSLLENFDVNLNEWQNMQLNDFNRIWDCGNYKYIITKENLKNLKTK